MASNAENVSIWWRYHLHENTAEPTTLVLWQYLQWNKNTNSFINHIIVSARVTVSSQQNNIGHLRQYNAEAWRYFWLCSCALCLPGGNGESIAGDMFKYNFWKWQLVNFDKSFSIEVRSFDRCMWLMWSCEITGYWFGAATNRDLNQW